MVLQEWKTLALRGDELYRQCLSTADAAALQKALECFREAASMSSQGIGDVAWTFSALACALQLRFEWVGDRQDLEDAIRYHQQALDLKPSSHPDRCLNLVNLAIVLLHRFRQTEDRMDLDDAIKYYQDALELRPPGHPDRSLYLMKLATALLIRFKQSSDRADLNDAIKDYQEGLDSMPPDHPDRSPDLNNLANALLARFRQIGDRVDLNNAIKYHQEALNLKPPGHADRSISLMNLATVLLTRFGQAGDRVDLDVAIRYQEEGLGLRQPGHPDRSISLMNLANTLRARFGQSGDRMDLDYAIRYHQEALDLRPPGHPDRSLSLMNLASALLTRFEQVGDRVDLDVAIRYYQEGLDLMTPGHTDRSSILNNLAIALWIRFGQVGDRQDLDISIRYHQEGLDLRPTGHPARPSSLINLANAFQTRFRHIGDRIDLDNAIRYYQEGLDLMPPGHPNRSVNFNNLAIVLWYRFELVRDRVDLDDAIRYYQEALDLAPPGHLLRPSALKNLANALRARFQCDGNRLDLDSAITYYQEGLDRTVPGHPLRSDHLRSLALALWASSNDIAPDKQDTSLDMVVDCRKRILQLIEEATNSPICGPTGDRLRAGLTWVDIATQWSHPSSLEAYRKSLELLGVLIATESSLESRHLRLISKGLQRSQTLAVDSAACAISLGHIETALEMLEQGRSLLFNQAGRYRTPVDGLEVTLAEEFRAISARMEVWAMNNRVGGVDPGLNRAMEDVVAVYQKLSADWAGVVERIRTVPEFESFLMPMPFTTLQMAAVEGPVIVVNLSRMRSDVVVVTSHGPPLLVPLRAATPYQISDLADRTNSSTCQHEMKEVLKALWQLIVQPVTKVLLEDIKLKPGSRIWWCPTGAASLLPLHAAGDYCKRSEIFPDLFISSYTTTLTSLIRARKNLPPAIAIATNPNILLLGQSQDPTLPTVGAEIKAIERIAEKVTLLDGNDATCESSLRAMIEHSWVHLACHGKVDEDHPFKSHFRLHGGPLTLLDIARQNLPRAYQAFLSSCHSAEGNRERPDEALHLTAGVQFAGFRSAIGTLWAVDGEDGPAVAEVFYSNLLGSGPETTKSSAVALHRAVKELRKRRVPNTRWACFVHYGC